MANFWKKSIPNICRAKISQNALQNIYIKAQFESQKQLDKVGFETLKYLQQSHAFKPLI
jgi:hypothetical protein